MTGTFPLDYPDSTNVLSKSGDWIHGPLTLPATSVYAYRSDIHFIDRGCLSWEKMEFGEPEEKRHLTVQNKRCSIDQLPSLSEIQGKVLLLEYKDSALHRCLGSYHVLVICSLIKDGDVRKVQPQFAHP